MEQSSSNPRAFVISHLGLRRAIGTIGFLLPIVLALGRIISDGPGIESTISSYYYTSMRDVFVGAMFAIGVFLFSYRGYDSRDEIAADLAALFAIALALLPTTPHFNQTPHQRLVGDIHLVFASGFFLVLAYFSLFLFTKTDPSNTPTRQKLRRNQVYRVCGGLIVAPLFMIAIIKLFPKDASLMRLNPVFWLESVAVVAFGISWLTKGEAILKDQAEPLPVRVLSRHQ